MSNYRFIPPRLREGFVSLDTGEVVTLAGDPRLPDSRGRICVDGEQYPVHRLVKFLAGYDVSGHHVHHVNFRHDDNRLANLLCLTPKQHASVHSLFRLVCDSHSIHSEAAYLGNSTAHWKFVKGLSPKWRDFYSVNSDPHCDLVIVSAKQFIAEASALIFAILETGFEFEQRELLHPDFRCASLLPFPLRMSRDWLDDIEADHGPCIRGLVEHGKVPDFSVSDTGYRYRSAGFTR